MDDDVAAAERELTVSLRRIASRLIALDAPADELMEAAAMARALADRLDALPARSSFVDGRVGNFHRDSPWTGTANAIAPPAEIWVVADSQVGENGWHTEGRVVFGAAYEGPLGNVHGGCIAGVMDVLLGLSHDDPGVTGTLTITYRRPSPLRREISLRGWVDRIDGRKRWIKGTASLGDDVLVEAEGVFIAPR